MWLQQDSNPWFIIVLLIVNCKTVLLIVNCKAVLLIVNFYPPDNSTTNNGVQNLTSIMRTKKRCHSVSESNTTCVCRLHVCMSWYPCDLKFCQGELEGKATEFRCGIKTCGKCRDFDFLVSEKNQCFWDNRQKS